MKKKIHFSQGDVFEFRLPNGKYAYGRRFNGAAVGFYKELSDIPNTPPIESNDYFFIINFQSGVIEEGLYPIVANVQFNTKEEANPPPMGGKNPVYGYAISYLGEMRKATEEECSGLEPLTIFNIESVISRIMSILSKES